MRYNVLFNESPVLGRSGQPVLTSVDFDDGHLQISNDPDPDEEKIDEPSVAVQPPPSQTLRRSSRVPKPVDYLEGVSR